MKLSLLHSITGPVQIASLNQATLKELQTALHLLGFPVGDLDGLMGARTKTAWAEFKTDEFLGNPDLIGPGAVELLQKRLDALVQVKHDFSTVEGTKKAIIHQCKSHGLGLPSQIAYVLATVEWESAKTFRPVREAFFLGEPAAETYRKKLKYYPYYGRGYVQLTWKANYASYGKLLSKDLVGHPDLAMEPEVALFVLVHGFLTGGFTGRKLADYVNDAKTDFVNARRCINGLDKASSIAKLAEQHLKALS